MQTTDSPPHSDPQARIGAVKALYFPTFSLTGFLDLESEKLEDFVSASART